jgi:hypothetical protein
MGTFRFWDHYFITTLPWFGLLLGMLLEESILGPFQAGTHRALRSTIVIIACFVSLSFVLRHLTTLWLDGERRRGQFFGNPTEEPIANYIQHHVQPDESIFVWGFAPELYVSSKRRSASRFVYTTFPSGMVPWFYWLAPTEEQQLIVPGSQALLLQELTAQSPALILDIPNSMHGRSIRRYPELERHLEQHYCFGKTLMGKNNRIADIYHRRHADESCEQTFPPMVPLTPVPSRLRQNKEPNPVGPDAPG